MHLSRLTLNTANPAALRALADPYAMHQLVLSAFPDRENGGPGRVLYRVEPEATCRPPEVLVQSERRPHWEDLDRRVMLTTECKTFSPQFARSQRLRFRLRANPSARRVFQRASEGQPKCSGKRIGVYGEEAQRHWLDSKAEQAGFRVLECRLADRGFVVSRKPAHKEPMRHLCVDVEGILEVTDPDRFLDAIQSGIGSGKAFGFGLLSVARA